ncbi:hypothetical protein SMALA_3504 [Streptomyces malaysiensis subsp. malaysiensis]|nr:hypothetical protein SMALA_3504 [Streptomyces malaysiensis]
MTPPEEETHGGPLQARTRSDAPRRPPRRRLRLRLELRLWLPVRRPVSVRRQLRLTSARPRRPARPTQPTRQRAWDRSPVPGPLSWLLVARELLCLPGCLASAPPARPARGAVGVGSGEPGAVTPPPPEGGGFQPEGCGPARTDPFRDKRKISNHGPGKRFPHRLKPVVPR